jgi:hypothetical protein
MFKTIKVEVEDEVWRAFFRIFPGTGERSAYLRKVIYKTIAKADEYQDLADHIVEEIGEKGEET